MFPFKKTIAVIVLVTTGCYTAIPLASSPPPLGTDLVITLTDQGGPQLAAVLGPRVTGLSGKYLGESGDSLYLGVSTVALQNGNEQFWNGERVGVPKSLVAMTRERKVSVVKSALVVGALIAVLGAITAVVSSGNAGTKSTPPPKGQ